jgi:hypothetical protein
MYDPGKPIAPFRKPDYFDWEILTSLVSTGAGLAGTIFTGVNQSKQIDRQAAARLAELKATLDAGKTAATVTPSGSNNMVPIIVTIVAALIIIGLVIWAIARK